MLELAQRAALRGYAVVTGAYWAFTLTDGAIRMLVVLYFHNLGYAPFDVAMLFLFYEVFGIITNGAGGYLAARMGLNATLLIGMALQIVALGLLGGPDAWLSVPFVMACMALSGIAKDLNKMSAKTSVKLLVTEADEGAKLFRWVAALTGSKNALKGAGFFLGAALLEWLGYRAALWSLAGLLAVALTAAGLLLPRLAAKQKKRAPHWRELFSHQREINVLAAARLFLFGARDVWFVVALPLFLDSVLSWDFWRIGGFMALWVIGYGVVQASAPMLWRRRGAGHEPNGNAARLLALALTGVPVLIAMTLNMGWSPGWVIVCGLMLFGVIFALNSAVHSYLILRYADRDAAAMKVGFYYMANAAGRLTGTVLSGWLYQGFGLIGCLWASALMLAAAWLLSHGLPTQYIDPSSNH
ncbi:organoarsenical effux MFS transporter ArsJ [Magnetofaba australis]|uniref:Putative transporter membrane protein n=1 Tax=Magnetofaba australis IT-1 TaxID=1434232 RepID=A0A1Y2K617_9PROT|nr:organoarsenical effux MFS transporter ArsJ [Magnetofaba australis]OSM05124.1 putative transporter membrane protein [Magnetofaba australis IT-1]